MKLVSSILAMNVVTRPLFFKTAFLLMTVFSAATAHASCPDPKVNQFYVTSDNGYQVYDSVGNTHLDDTGALKYVEIAGPVDPRNGGPHTVYCLYNSETNGAEHKMIGKKNSNKIEFKNPEFWNPPTLCIANDDPSRCDFSEVSN